MTNIDPRLGIADWDPSVPAQRRVVRTVVTVNAVLVAWYLTWLLVPGRVGNPVLYAVLVVAELYNVVQAAAFWWTVWADEPTPAAPAWFGHPPEVDVLIPVYNEPVDIVEPTVAAAVALRGARVRVSLLDDGARPEMAAMAARHGAHYVRRHDRNGAKAGNINHALGRTSAPYVAVFDCDHVPEPRFLEATLGHFADDRVALVQTPQYYANAHDGGIAAAASAQQSLFFGAIARGKARRGAMFCCGTNMVLRREALDAVGGFPENSLTEDFALSVRLHEQGWRSEYVAEVLAQGFGPEDMASYVSQQRRWAQGCLSAIPVVLRSKLPWRKRLQYVSSSSFFLSGWTVLIYMSLPILRIVTGAQPIAGVSADQFLLHFAPYFLASIATVAIASGGTYTFSAFALTTATFGVHIRATVRTVLGRRGKFVVTPKRGASGRQFRPVGAALCYLALLALAAVWGVASGAAPALLNNVAYVGFHITILLSGAWPALVGSRPEVVEPFIMELVEEAA